MKELPLILASASPRRSELLASAGVEFEVRPANIDEGSQSGERPIDLAVRLACEKAQAVAIQFPDRLVLGADTIIEIGGEERGKPSDREDARRMLRELSGGVHFVHTAYALVHHQSQICRERVTTAVVTFCDLSDDEISNYLTGNEWIDKAGAYAIQGQAAQFIASFQGSFDGIVGLPMDEVLADLVELKLCQVPQARSE